MAWQQDRRAGAIPPPLTLGRIHEGTAGKNGAVKVPLFGSAMPHTVHSAALQVQEAERHTLPSAR